MDKKEKDKINLENEKVAHHPMYNCWSKQKSKKGLKKYCRKIK